MPSDAPGDAHVPRELSGYGECSVVLTARRCDHAFGDFLLHHDRDREAVWVVEESEQHGSGYVVRQVSYCLIIPAEIQLTFHKVRKSDGKPGISRLKRAQVFFQAAVDLKRENARTGGREFDRERAHSRAYFDGGIICGKLRIGGYCGKEIAVGQEVLSE